MKTFTRSARTPSDLRFCVIGRFDPAVAALLGCATVMAGTPQRTQWQDLGSAWNHVIEFSCALAVYGALGYFADKWLHTGHVLFFGGLLLGLVLGLYVLNKRLAHEEAQLAEARRAERADT